MWLSLTESDSLIRVVPLQTLKDVSGVRFLSDLISRLKSDKMRSQKLKNRLFWAS